MQFSLKTKVVLAVLMVALVLAAGTIQVSYSVYSRTMDAHYQTLAMNVAKTAAQVVDKDAARRLTTRVMDIYRAQCVGGEAPPFDDFTDEDWAAYLAAFAPAMVGDDYARLFDTLRMLREENDVLWMYICYMDSATDKAVYIIDSVPPDDEDASPVGSCDPIVEQNRELMRQGVYDFPAYITNFDEYGWLCSASAAIKDAEGRVIANAYVDLSMNDVMRDRALFLQRLCMLVALTAAALVALLAYVANRSVVRPVNHLASAAEQFVSQKQSGEGASAISQLSIHTGDEIEHLSHAIQHMEHDINAYIANLTAVTAERERIGAELDVAKTIQASMLPCMFPAFPSRQEFDIYATMTPAKEVAGDFYDFFLVDDNHLVLVMADVSGKGVPAALFMMIAKTLIKSAAQMGLSPKAILEKVNGQLCETNEAQMFVTVWLGILEISTGQMVCANAGHEYPALMRRGEAFTLYKDKHGFVLAGMEGTRYREYTLTLEPGDRLFVYTDGVAEATDAHNALFGTERMLAALNAHRAADCEALLAALHGEICAFAGDAPQFDDITMLCLTYKGEAAMRRMSLPPTLEALPDATAFFEEQLAAAHAPAKVIAQVNVAVDEIFSNIARYSGATAATLGCAMDDGCVTLRFSDNGLPYDPTRKDDPDTTAGLEEREIGGLGIFMVKQIMDEVAYAHESGLNVLTLTKRW